jgi:hypothetical protein
MAARPGLLDEHVGGDAPYVVDHVELAKPAQPLPLVGISSELSLVVVEDLAL